MKYVPGLIPPIESHTADIKSHIDRIAKEFQEGFDFLKKYPKSVTIFGSSLMHKDTEDYVKVEELSGRIARELGYAVLTGGGPGIMEAANKGAYEAGGVSLGFNISLPHEHLVNKFLSQSIRFSYFFSRKAMMTFAGEAFVFFPGGFGTMDELFSILTLIQTDKIPRVPVILYDSKFWASFRSFIKDDLLEKFHTVEEKNLDLFEITDSFDRVIELIKKAPVSEWWRNIN